MSDETAPDPADDPDAVLPTEDDDPESLAGGPVVFDPDSPDESDGGEQAAGT